MDNMGSAVSHMTNLVSEQIFPSVETNDKPPPPEEIKYTYKNTVNEKYWKKFLGKELTAKDKSILDETDSEVKLNFVIIKISEFIKAQEPEKCLHIAKLTNMHGNCLFESLQFYNLCDNIDVLRRGISILMLSFKNIKNLIPNQDLSLYEYFGMTNEIAYVIDKNNKKLYKYTYDSMCYDLASDCSWTRLGTEMVLSFMAVILNLKFYIYHDSNYITKIEPVNNSETKLIRLALIGEIHYMPIAEGKPNENSTVLKYTDALRKFHEWAREKEKEKIEYERMIFQQYATYESTKYHSPPPYNPYNHEHHVPNDVPFNAFFHHSPFIRQPSPVNYDKNIHSVHDYNGVSIQQSFPRPIPYDPNIQSFHGHRSPDYPIEETYYHIGDRFDHVERQPVQHHESGDYLNRRFDIHQTQQHHQYNNDIVNDQSPFGDDYSFNKVVRRRRHRDQYTNYDNHYHDGQNHHTTL